MKKSKYLRDWTDHLLKNYDNLKNDSSNSIFTYIGEDDDVGPIMADDWLEKNNYPVDYDDIMSGNHPSKMSDSDYLDMKDDVKYAVDFAHDLISNTPKEIKSNLF